MVVNECRACAGHGEIYLGGWLWWAQWKKCEACGGDGYAKPPGWPDPVEIARLRPAPPPPPPMPNESAAAYTVRTRSCPACGAQAGQPCDGQSSIASVHDERRGDWNRKRSQGPEQMLRNSEAAAQAVAERRKREVTIPDQSPKPGDIIGTERAETDPIRDPLLPGETVDAYIERMGGWPARVEDRVPGPWPHPRTGETQGQWYERFKVGRAALLFPCPECNAPPGVFCRFPSHDSIDPCLLRRQAGEGFLKDSPDAWRKIRVLSNQEMAAAMVPPPRREGTEPPLGVYRYSGDPLLPTKPAKPETVLKPEGQAFAPPMPEVPPITVLREDHCPTPENFAADRAAYEKAWPVWGIEYPFQGSKFLINVPAPNASVAFDHLEAAARNGKCVGELKGTVPGDSTGAGLFVRALCIFRTFFKV